MYIDRKKKHTQHKKDMYNSPVPFVRVLMLHRVLMNVDMANNISFHH